MSKHIFILSVHEQQVLKKISTAENFVFDIEYLTQTLAWFTPDKDSLSFSVERKDRTAKLNAFKKAVGNLPYNLRLSLGITDERKEFYLSFPEERAIPENKDMRKIFLYRLNNLLNNYQIKLSRNGNSDCIKIVSIILECAAKESPANNIYYNFESPESAIHAIERHLKNGW